MLEVLVALSGLGLGVAGFTVAGLSWRRASTCSAAVDATGKAMAEVRMRRDEALRQVDALTMELERHKARVATLGEREERLNRQNASGERALREAESRLAAEVRAANERAEQAVRDSAERAGEALRDAEERVASAERRMTRLKTELAAAQGLARRSRQALASVGLVVSDERRDPFAPEHRMVTRRVIQGLLVDCGANSAGVVDSAGHIVVGPADDVSVQRLAMLVANVAFAQGELATVLCAPVASVSLTDRRFANHLLRIEHSRRWIGVENDGVAPLFAMRNALMRMVGMPDPSSPVPEVPQELLSLDHTPDEELGRRLSGWASRWGASAVTVLDVEGRPLASTKGAQPSAVMALRRRLTPLFLRLMRDGRFLEDATLIARSADDTSLTLRMIGGDIESPLAAIVGQTEMPEEGLDELIGLVRWHLNSHDYTAREAS